MLAQLNPHHVQALLTRTGLPPATPFTHTEREALESELGVRCVAAGVPSGRPGATPFAALLKSALRDSW